MQTASKGFKFILIFNMICMTKNELEKKINVVLNQLTSWIKMYKNL